MLWYKGWLEIRMRLAMFAGMFGLSAIGLASMKPPAQANPPPVGIVIAGFAAYAVLFGSLMLAGAGIVTQAGFQSKKGQHGSTLFTLSMPVSRMRLLAVRVTLGWLGLAAMIGLTCVELWMAFPALRAANPAAEMGRYAITLLACGSALYSISVLLATFLDDVWRVWAGLTGFVALWFLSNRLGVPASVNIFRAMVDTSPLIAHTMPWGAMAFSMGLAAVLFLAALRVVQAREY